MNFNTLPDIPALGQWQRRFVLIGGAGLLALIAGAFIDRPQFYQSYLLGFLFWSSVTLGCMGIVMLQHLTGGAWGIAIRRILEAGTRTLPVIALLFIPIIIGMKNGLTRLGPRSRRPPEMSRSISSARLPRQARRSRRESGCWEIRGPALRTRSRYATHTKRSQPRSTRTCG